MGKSLKALAAVLVLCGAAAGISYATNAVTRTATSVLQACANGTNGNLRLVANNATDCRTNETGVSWNVVGPAGPAGAPGKDGTNGTNGTNGTDGVSPTVQQLAAGDPNCADGGVSITDAAGHAGYVCNGAAGKDGDPFSGTFTSPNGLYSLKVADTGIELRAPASRLTMNNTSLDMRADTTMTIRSGLTLTLDGVLSTLKGSDVTIGSPSCAPPLRQGDTMFVVLPQNPAGSFPVTAVPSGSVVCIG